MIGICCPPARLAGAGGGGRGAGAGGGGLQGGGCSSTGYRRNSLLCRPRCLFAHRCVQMEQDLQDQIDILLELQKVENNTLSLRGQGSGQALAGKRCDIPNDQNPSPLNKPRRHSMVDLRDSQRTRASDTVETNLHPSVGCGCNEMEHAPLELDSEPCPMDEDIEVLRKNVEAEIPTDVDNAVGDDATEWNQRKQALETNWSQKRSSFAYTAIISLAPPEGDIKCSKCMVRSAVLRCLDCEGLNGVYAHVCGTCDQLHPHANAHFHRRQTWDQGYFQPIPPQESFDVEGNRIQIGERPTQISE